MGGMMIHFAVGESDLGIVAVAASQQGVCAIVLGEDRAQLINELQHYFPKAMLVAGDEACENWLAEVVRFVATPTIGLDLPLDIQGTAFQQRVWQALCEIPVGETASYTEIAQRIGAPKSVRAVAGACAANKLALAIPCHRVIASGGGIGGYSGGVWRKEFLLALEAKHR